MISSKRVEAWDEKPPKKRYQVAPTNSLAKNAITFYDDDIRGIQTSHNNMVMISMMVANYNVKLILVNNKSFANILFYDAFQKMKLSTENL